MGGMTSESSQTYKCRYCEKLFRRESTLTAHLCEQKRRAQQQNETGVQFGYKAYIQFYESTQGSAKTKSYETFASSPYYNAFVKYGRYCVAIRAINFTSFTAWLLKNNKKLDYWCKDSQYEEWMFEYLRKEAPQDALERALREMQEYAETRPDLKNGFNDYFRYGNANRICHHITMGRISPWVIFNCVSGVEFLERLDEEQIGIIIKFIDPEFWQKKFKDYIADTEWTKGILEKAGL
jgi:hypothetical protein